MYIAFGRQDRFASAFFEAWIVDAKRFGCEARGTVPTLVAQDGDTIFVFENRIGENTLGNPRFFRQCEKCVALIFGFGKVELNCW